MDYELTLFDRIEVIKSVNQKYDLEHNAYISFSGGKDSTILHHLIDLALPNNKIPRVFINTGIEYNHIVEFVQKLAEKDDRFIIIKPSKPIKQTLELYGYPFKSKEHSLRIDQFNKGTNANYLKKYINGYDVNGRLSTFTCPKKLLYQFEERGKYHYSNRCCYELKKKPAYEWQKENGKKIVMTGMRHEEAGNRKRLGCITDHGTKFHPLIKVDEEWENEFINHQNIKLCDLYYEPFNFKRTGCKGCPFSLDIQKQLDIMKIYLPNEYKQCEIIWAPVYEEYRRIKYRLKGKENMNETTK